MSDTAKFAPVSVHRFAHALLPVFDDGWKAACRSCEHFAEGQIHAGIGASMLCMLAGSVRALRPGNTASCGDARSVRGLCGPDAKLRVAKA